MGSGLGNKHLPRKAARTQGDEADYSWNKTHPLVPTPEYPETCCERTFCVKEVPQGGG